MENSEAIPIILYISKCKKINSVTSLIDIDFKKLSAVSEVQGLELFNKNTKS